MPALVVGIHAGPLKVGLAPFDRLGVDGRDMPGHDA